MIVLTLLILFIIAAVGSAALGSPMLFVVRQQEASIIERLGKFNRIVQPGLHFLIPIIERRAAEVNLRTQEARYSLNGKTKDNVTIGTAVSVQFRVDQMPAQTVEQSGVYRSYYILSNPIDQMESYIADALRSASASAFAASWSRCAEVIAFMERSTSFGSSMSVMSVVMMS